MDTTNPYSVDLLAGGPGAPPQPWVVNGATIRYDGCVMVPSNVVNGDTGHGTINTNALYVKGVQFVNPVGAYLPLTGGSLSGSLGILNPSYLQMGGGSAGQALVTNGAGGLSWSAAPPGGPYLQLAGGALSGPLQIAGPSGLVMGGGAPGNVLSTNGLGILSWIAPASGGGGGGSIVIGDTPPNNPTIGTLWWDSIDGQLYIWYTDANSSQWVITNTSVEGPQGPAGTPAPIRATPLSFCFPGKPSASSKLSIVIPWAATIAANFANSQTYADTVGTAAAAFAVWQIQGGTTKTQIGTITLTAGSNTAHTFTGSAVTLAAGDVLQIIAPATQDTTLADVSLTLYVMPS